MRKSKQRTGESPGRFAYDGLGHLVWADNPESGTTSYKAYDALGNLLSVQYANSNGATYAYDWAGRLTQRTVIWQGSLVASTVVLNVYDVSTPPSPYSLGKLTGIQSYDQGQPNGVQPSLLLTESRLYNEP